MAVSIINIAVVVDTESQYTAVLEDAYTTFTDGVDIFRDGIRDGFYVVDKTLTPTGFAGDEDTDWENVVSVEVSEDDVYRKGVRSGAFILDYTLTATGFNGREDTDWENVRQLI